MIFCQVVDDPSAVPEEFSSEEAQENERLRLFALISELVQWENTTNEEGLNRARAEIRRSWQRCCADNADHPEARSKKQLIERQWRGAEGLAEDVRDQDRKTSPRGASD